MIKELFGRYSTFKPTPGTKLLHFGGSAYQLFDLNEDAAEKKDLAPGNKDKLKEAITRMQTFRAGLKEICLLYTSPSPRD